MFDRLKRSDRTIVTECLNPAERSKAIVREETHRSWATALGLIAVGLLFVLLITSSSAVWTGILLFVIAMHLQGQASANLRLLKLSETAALEERVVGPRAA